MARLTHGLEPLRHLEVAAGLCSVAQDPVGRRFVVLDGAGRLHLHREDGWACLETRGEGSGERQKEDRGPSLAGGRKGGALKA